MRLSLAQNESISEPRIEEDSPGDHTDGCTDGATAQPEGAKVGYAPGCSRGRMIQGYARHNALRGRTRSGAACILALLLSGWDPTLAGAGAQVDVSAILAQSRKAADEAHVHSSTKVDLYNRLGRSFAMAGERNEAQVSFAAALALTPCRTSSAPKDLRTLSIVISATLISPCLMALPEGVSQVLSGQTLRLQDAGAAKIAPPFVRHAFQRHLGGFLPEQGFGDAGAKCDLQAIPYRVL